MRLTPELLLYAYSKGIFPMAHEDGQIYWHDPDPRAILPLAGLHLPRRLARTMQQKAYDIRINSAFEVVIAACAAPASGRESTWISDELISAYANLHRLGFAHSVEAWQDGRLVGGLYGVALGGLFAGESMFHQQRDASKVCLMHLVERLKARGFRLLDVQFSTPHLAQFGVVEITRAEYRRRLAESLAVSAQFDP